MALSEFAARKAKPREKPYKITDGGGLHLLVQTSGSKLWRLKYSFDGKEKVLSFGIKYLFLDARYEKVRIGGVVRDAAVLSAIGIGPDEGGDLRNNHCRLHRLRPSPR